MAAVLELANRRYKQAVRLRDRTQRALRRQWAGIDPDDISNSFRRIFPALLATLTAAQLEAARGATEYVTATAEAQGLLVFPQAEVRPEGIAGWDSGGWPLDESLLWPLIRAKQAISLGRTPREALAHGRNVLELIGATQVQDAGRNADQVAVAATPRLGYVRMLSLPSCPRCAILAGKWFRYNQGFQRHPRCDCRHIPASEDNAGDLRTDPMAAYRAGQIHGLTEAERKALDEGADIGRVVNARRGMYVDRQGRRLTRANARRGQRRPTVQQIFRDATSREEAVRLLRLHGYII